MTQFTIILLIFLSPRLGAQTCIAHRANINGAVENSLDALSQAVTKNVSGIEFDVHFTADGMPLIYHDKKLGKHLKGSSCPLKKKIKKLNYSEIQNHCFLENGEQIPRLSHALEILQDYEGYIFLELKAKPNDRFFELLEDYNIKDSPKLKILSFKKNALRKIRRTWDEVQTLLLSLIIPRGLFFKNVGFNKHLKLFIPLFRGLKKGVGIYTLNEKKGMLKAIKKNADFIITDEYELCLQTLNEI